MVFSSVLPGRVAACALAAALALAACHKREQPSMASSVPPSIANRVTVLNADVLVIDGQHVQLANASSPERAIHARCWAEAVASDSGRAFVQDMVAHARSISFRPNGKTDDYNRALGLVVIDGVDLGDVLYDRGLAARPSGARFDWCQPISQHADGAPPLSSVISIGD